ncbi:NRDE family protein [Bordetella sp. FB-8]|uniref:NRDE family protein n=1 Tax=Bordetella sp. FB-8 TaxID=1159870 RepID=UPI000378D956|nr:NRDE family protein [Bordetella sp. FB-8]
MCLAVLALRSIPGVPVLVAANRDEFHARPAAPAARWDGEPAIHAGRDLQAGGTWMGATEDGRFALVTNYREPGRQRSGAPSRGALVQDWLRGQGTIADYLAWLHAEGSRYNGFNLIVGDAGRAWYYGNRGDAPRELPDGVYGLSNHLLDTPWPKLVRVRRAFEGLIAQAGPARPSTEALYAMLHDRTPTQDAQLPDTGLPLERERMLGSPFIVSPDYGTRASTVLALRAAGDGELHERSYDPQGMARGDSDLSWGRRAAQSAQRS